MAKTPEEKRPFNCTCSEAYGVTPEICGKHPALDNRFARIAPQYCETHKVVHKCELMLATPAPADTGAAAPELIVGDPRGRCLKGGKMWCCSLPKNHQGDHKAYHSHDSRTNVMDVWPSEDNAMPANAGSTTKIVCSKCARIVSWEFDSVLWRHADDGSLMCNDAAAIQQTQTHEMKRLADTGDTPQPPQLSDEQWANLNRFRGELIDLSISHRATKEQEGILDALQIVADWHIESKHPKIFPVLAATGKTPDALPEIRKVLKLMEAFVPAGVKLDEPLAADVPTWNGLCDLIIEFAATLPAREAKPE